MEEDIDIYADLSSFNIESDVKAEKACNCEELQKTVTELTSKIQDVENINNNLEKNLSSLLKTAKAEIARKDRMLEDLRNQLNNTVFRRNNNRSLNVPISKSYQQNAKAEKCETVTPSMHSKEFEFKSYEFEPHKDEYESRKPQNDVAQVPVTIFGKRLHKKIMDSEMEEKKHIASSKLDTEANKTKTPEDYIVESDKENGSESSLNNANESNTITQNFASSTLHGKNTGKRLIDEDNTCRSKRLKNMDNVDNEDKGDDADYNHVIQYDTKDTRYKVADNIANFEDRATAVQSFQKDQTPFDAKRKFTPKYEETKQTRTYKNRWERKERSGSEINYDVSHASKRSTDSLKNFRITSTSNERSNSEPKHDYYANGYSKSNYRRDSPNSRSFSRSRNDYESSSSHCLRSTSRRTYKDKKYDDYKYDNRYRDNRRWSHDVKESNYYRTRHNSKYRDDLRNKSRHSSCDVEDKKDKNNSYKSERCSYRAKRGDTSDSDRRSHENSKFAAVMDSRVSSSRTVLDTAVDRSVKKNTEQLCVKNEPCTFVYSVESTLTNITTADTSNLEDGEILQSPNCSPEKKYDDRHSADVSKHEVTEKNVKQIVSVESTDDSAPVSAFEDNTPIVCQSSTDDTKQVEGVVEIDAERAETSLPFPQGNFEEIVVEVVTQLRANPADENFAVNDDNCNNDGDAYKSCFDENAIDPITQNAVINEEVYVNNNDDDNCKNCVDENLGDLVTVEGTAGYEEVINFHNENTTKSEEVSDSNSAAKIEKIDNLNTDDVLNTDGTHKTGSNASRSNSPTNATNVEVAPNCDIDNNTNENQIYNKRETFQQISDRSNAEVSHACFNDHSYIRNIVTEASDLDTVKESSASPERRQITETATLKETKTEKTVNVQPVDIKKATSSTVKNKKDQQAKTVVISRRRKAVTLSDNSASMTVLKNMEIAKSSIVANDNNVNNKNDSLLKPRACKFARAVKAPCK